MTPIKGNIKKLVRFRICRTFPIMIAYFTDFIGAPASYSVPELDMPPHCAYSQLHVASGDWSHISPLAISWASWQAQLSNHLSAINQYGILSYSRHQTFFNFLRYRIAIFGTITFPSTGDIKLLLLRKLSAQNHASLAHHKVRPTIFEVITIIFFGTNLFIYVTSALMTNKRTFQLREIGYRFMNVANLAS